MSTPAPAAALAAHPRASFGQLLGLAWPIIISRSAQVVIGVSDGVMVAHLGAAALAATTTGAMNCITLFIFPLGVVFIVSSFASQLFGERDFAGARRYGFYGLAVALITQLLGMLSVPFVPAALAPFDYAPDVRAYMTDYLQLRLPSVGAAVGIEALANYYGGLGNTRLPMAVNLFAMVLNVAGNWILIDGHLGAPALGPKGAALASSLATIVAFFAFYALFSAGAFAPGGRARSRLSLAELLRMLRFGVPTGLNWFFELLAFGFFINVVVAGLGTEALAALMAVMQVNQVAFMPGFALASAGSILVGQAIGAGARDEVPRTVRLTVLTAAGWMGLVGLAYVSLPALVLGPFLDGNVASAALHRTGARLLALAAAWQIFDAASMALAEALRAAGDTAFTMWARLIIAWAIFVPGTLVTTRVFHGGDIAAAAWVAIYLALLAVTLAWRFQRGAWRKIDLTHGGGAPPLG